MEKVSTGLAIALKSFGLEERDVKLLKKIAKKVFKKGAGQIFSCPESQIIFIASLVGGLKKKGIIDPEEIEKRVKTQCAG